MRLGQRILRLERDAPRAPARPLSPHAEEEERAYYAHHRIRARALRRLAEILYAGHADVQAVRRVYDLESQAWRSATVWPTSYTGDYFNTPTIPATLMTPAAASADRQLDARVRLRLGRPRTDWPTQERELRALGATLTEEPYWPNGSLDQIVAWHFYREPPLIALPNRGLRRPPLKAS